MSRIPLHSPRSSALQASVLLTTVLLSLPPSASADPAPPAASVVATGKSPSAGTAASGKGVAVSPEIEALMQQAEALRGKGDYTAAAAKAEEVLRKQPKLVQALLFLGTLEGGQGKLDLAIGHLKQAVAASPDNLFAHKVLANALAQKGEAAHALEALAPVLKATPVDAQAWLLATQIEAQRNDFAAAHRNLDKVFKAEPNNAQAHQLAVRLAMAEKKPEEAVKQLQALIRTQPDDVEAMLLAASLESELGHPASAASLLEKARKTKPSAPEPVVASIQLALRGGHPDEAATYLPKLDALLPNVPNALSLKAEVLMAQGKAKDAIAPLEAALAKTPDTPLFVQLHQALLAANQTAEADKRLAAWIDSHGDDLRLRFYAAGSAGRRKDYAGAAAQYRKILEKDANNLGALNDLAQTLELMKDPTSVDYAEKAYKLAPDSPVTENTLGVILMTAGKNDRGLPLLKQAAEHAPTHPEVRFDYARALVVTGDKVRAKAELEALLALKTPFAAEAGARDMLKTLGGS